jgi:hypothetical protein
MVKVNGNPGPNLQLISLIVKAAISSALVLSL